LSYLSADGDVNVIFAVIENPHTPVDALMKLADYSNGQIRLMLARRPTTPAEVLEKLANSRFYEYRREVAANPACPALLLEALALDPDPHVSKVAKRRLEKTPCLGLGVSTAPNSCQ
jgi:hypothetical protein